MKSYAFVIASIENGLADFANFFSNFRYFSNGILQKEQQEMLLGKWE